MLTITEAARRADCRQSTIRYYEKVGLLPPAHRGVNGYRYFDTSDIERLAFVKRARELGFAIESVRDLLRLADHPRQPCEAADTLIDEQVDSVRQRIAQLSALETQLMRLQHACNGDHSMHECGVLAALSTTDSI
ncbi:MerR family transcriptional regulator [Salinisphaera orenii]|uniref:MerR family transcriptional regulator n=1 Tax=Salinisphaera orenii TaxID=856731 RepID=UPI0013A62FE1